MVKTEKTNGLAERLVLPAMVFAFGGFFGFIYEELFYRIDLGYWVKRGGTFGPWIPIYGVGALLIVLTTARLRRHPALVFATAGGVCGALEYATGWVLLNAFNIRLWDYNTEMWNWGNLGGFVCLRSVLFFGASALFLQYAVMPVMYGLKKRCTTAARRAAALLPAALFLLDAIVFRLCHLL